MIIMGLLLGLVGTDVNSGVARYTFDIPNLMDGMSGLTEATETLLAFAAMCLWPQAFPVLAGVFAGLCGLTVLTRLWFGWRALSCDRSRTP